MSSTHFLPARFQLAITLLLAIAPFISAIHPPSYPGPKPTVQQRGNDTGLPAGWRNPGCYTDDPEIPTLTSLRYSDTVGMTVMHCINFCIDHGGHTFAGLENGSDCYCGNTLTNGSAQAPTSDCTSACTGDPTQNCGGPHTLNLYWNGHAPQPSPVMVQNPSNWFLMGCYYDANNARTLSTPAVLDGGPYANDAEICIAWCTRFGYKFAGMESADECWCDSSIKLGRTPVEQMHCMLACPGNSLQLCGGPNSLVIYSATKPPG